ncbi:Serine/threonine-protein kinase PknH [Aquisphaera giovannonii]|uniref:Serine/threonine-protein kinase PknH n=1 Tax=Aquisphaera giovannonii TaxID=406548 RepID=A0A5B9WEJ7_9BACT|nr:serine/threonine-protein kinase [Aquisphaera giovannonii]QEH38475.1 Serine/threonine-protein kinase PknH [Aquisphaera giovannonii]
MTAGSRQATAGASGFAAGGPGGATSPRRIQRVLDDFTRRRGDGEVGDVEGYLAEAGPLPDDLVVELAYREYCLREEEGEEADEESFLARFPAHRAALGRLLAVHRAWLAAPEGEGEGDWTRPVAGELAFESGVGPGLEELPGAGDEIGPFVLRREIGQGSFARVFIAEQADLENRLVVVKVSTRRTREPWLLARVRHAHIVEILLHAEVNDGAFQLLCMPFEGGATLAAVLERGRAAGGPPRHRGALLQDLDAVAAPEYAAVAPAGPARELLGRLGDAHALAWIAARLAEALDYAFGRGVAHGDVKPSNILLTADGNPLLLDFNLSQDWSARTDPRGADAGGTLAYMAPERLRALAARADGDHGEGAGADPDADTEARPADAGEGQAAADATAAGIDARRADIYSLGMVLLEALAGSAAGVPGRGEGRAGLADLARAHAAPRERGAGALIRDAEERGGRRIPRGLRHVLERCLAADPEARYRRPMELAEDLDRWRSDRPPAYAREPFWSEALPRWARRRRRALAVAAVALVVSLATAGLARLASHWVLRGQSLSQLARIWDLQEAGVYQYRRPYGMPLAPRESPDVLATAAAALRDYRVLGPEDWRRGEEYLSLPPADRFDLEAWLMEEAFRYAAALSRQADSPVDWLQATAALDRADPTLRLPALEPLRRRLGERLGRSKSASRVARILDPGKAGPATPPGPDAAEYLLGVADELADESYEGDPALAARALRHYQAVLDRHPDSFWAHYRSAVVCFRLWRWSEAARHVEHCLARRPGNGALRGQLAACLSELRLYDRARRECDLAIELSPNHGEFYRSRAFIRAALGQAEGVGEDIRTFEVLAGLADRPSPAEAAPLDVDGGAADRGLPLTFEALAGPQRGPVLRDDLGAIARGELDTRVQLASRITWLGISGDPGSPRPAPADDGGGMLGIAQEELDKILRLEPRHLNARILRMMQHLERGRQRAACDDLQGVLEHADLDAYLLKDDQREEFLHGAHRFATRGLIDEAFEMVQRVFRATRHTDVPLGRTRYYMARILAVSGPADAWRVQLAARHLFRAIESHPRFREWYRQDRDFDAVRGELDVILRGMREAEVTE